jgi:hypothetical protein
MAAQPVPDRELAALHERIGRDLAELRGRWTVRRGRALPATGDLAAAAVEMFRVVQAVRGLTTSLRPATSVILLLAGLRRRPSR